MKISLSRLDQDLSEFLPLKNSNKFLPPKIKVHSFRSDLFHEKMIQNIANTSLNKLAFKASKKNENEKDELKENTSFNQNHFGNKKINTKLKASDLHIEKENENDKDYDNENQENLIEKLNKRINCNKIIIKIKENKNKF